jgi:hypothetical protein
MQESDAFLLCYDITSEESLKALDDICKTMWRTKEDDIDESGNVKLSFKKKMKHYQKFQLLLLDVNVIWKTKEVSNYQKLKNMLKI